MGKLSDLIVLKLGGSLVTHKDTPMSFNRGAIRTVARAISDASLKRRRRFVLIHGGGSFGHYNAKKYGLSTNRGRMDPEGVARTNAAMIELHSSILNELLRARVNAATISPTELLDKDLRGLSPQGKKCLLDYLSFGLVPISFGFVQSDRNGSRVVSGDLLTEVIAQGLKARQVIFAMDVDGVYPTHDLNGKIIKILGEEGDVSTQKGAYDVTGGIEAKISVGFKLASKGIEVIFVNGAKYERLTRLLSGDDPERIVGTLIKPLKATSV